MRKSGLQKSTGSLGWEELRSILEVARAGSLAGAARRLGIEHSTIYRRIYTVESRLKRRLFDRTRSGYLPLPSVEPLIEAAVTMEEAMLRAERAVSGADDGLIGEIRLGASEVLGAYLVPRLIAPFLRTHPGIEIEVGITNRKIDLNRREADLALRVNACPPEHLIARQVGVVSYAVYGASTLLRGKSKPLGDLPWLGFEDGLAHVPQAAWLRANAPLHAPRTRWGSLISLAQAAASGLGVAVLTCLAANQTQGLIRMTDLLGEIPVYLLIHPDVHSNARVRALSQHISKTSSQLIHSLSRPRRAATRARNG